MRLVDAVGSVQAIARDELPAGEARVLAAVVSLSIGTDRLLDVDAFIAAARELDRAGLLDQLRRGST